MQVFSDRAIHLFVTHINMALDNELALISNGVRVPFATSTFGGLKEQENIIDGQRNTYWATSGLYPQFFIVSFPVSSTIKNISMRSYDIRMISVEKSTSDLPEKFDFVIEKELQLTDTQHQVEPLYVGEFIARHVRITIKSGYDHICSVYKIEVSGHDSKSNESSSLISQEEQKQWHSSSYSTHHGSVPQTVTPIPRSDYSDTPRRGSIPPNPTPNPNPRYWEDPSPSLVEQLPSENHPISPTRATSIFAKQTGSVLSPIRQRDFSPSPTESDYAESRVVHRSASSLVSDPEIASPRPSTTQSSLGIPSLNRKSQSKLEMFSETEEVPSGSDNEF